MMKSLLSALALAGTTLSESDAAPPAAGPIVRLAERDIDPILLRAKPVT